MTDVQILVGSVYGGALMTARKIRDELSSDQTRITVHEKPTLASLTGTTGPILVCTSTTGQGEVPDNLLPFYVELRDTLPMQDGRPFGIIVLGDSSYGDTFCGAGDQMEEALLEVAARKVSDTLRIDAMETMEPEAEALPWAKDWLEQVVTEAS
ncbi:flavodoxin domain-containing protein [Marinobacter bryozoorum]|uniref:flavodoxin domain-containing protein n=1 Tax=Marinobacter bryozoorum TaxID=256324 RepID=UPI0020037F22|nr:flavodoxin domain-containing protein [Marinobacter bryozoorum]MCK7542676.1 flavodoxin domain-containing protein [Marinobacter bryozoorum]